MDGPLKKTQLSVAISILLMSRISGATDFVVDTTADTVAPDGKLSLREAIQTANSNTPVNEDARPGDIDGDTISFDPGLFLTSQTISLAQGPLEITDDLTINGPSGPAEVIIDAQLASRLFEISSGERVQINNLSLQNGKDEGGAILLSEGGNLVLQNASISGCTANVGGAIYGMGTITITDSTISGNTAGQEGGGLWNSATGNMTITGTTISGNTANAAGSSGDQGGGGVFNNGGTITVLNSTVSGNTAGEEGGGLWNASGGMMTITGSTISGNTATAQSSAGNPGGGGVFNNGGTITITTSNIFDNIANGEAAQDQGGGGVFNNGGTITLLNSMVSGNTAGQEGGGLWNSASGAMTIDGTTISGNTVNTTSGSAQQGGGGIFNNGGTISLSASDIINNGLTGNASQSQGGGGVFNNGGTITVLNSTVSGNTAGQEGGGLWNSATGNMTITGTTISGNTANAANSADGQGGGGVFNNGGTISLKNSGVMENVVTGVLGPLDGGGGIFSDARNTTGALVSLSGTSIINNAVQDTRAGLGGRGGGVFVIADNPGAATITITGTTISGNSASHSGGGVDTEEGMLTIVNSTVSGNMAGNNGGGLNIGGGTQLDLQFTTIAYNTATEYGGGMMAGGGNVYSSLFANNGAVKGHDIYGAVDIMSYSVISNSDSLTVSSPLSNQLDVEPLIRVLADNGGPTPSHALQPGSPAIDKGDPQNCPKTDQRLARRDDGSCDAGAYEAGADPFTIFLDGFEVLNR